MRAGRALGIARAQPRRVAGDRLEGVLFQEDPVDDFRKALDRGELSRDDLRDAEGGGACGHPGPISAPWTRTMGHRYRIAFKTGPKSGRLKNSRPARRASDRARACRRRDRGGSPSASNDQLVPHSSRERPGDVKK
ncbi:MAG: hypothetical protein ACRDQ2_04015 [Gaiellales bacterium]